MVEPIENSVRARKAASRRVFVAYTLFVAVSASACKKNDAPRAQFIPETPDATAPETTSHAFVALADVAIGHQVGSDKRISNESAGFGPLDTVYASVHTIGIGNAALMVQWMYQTGQVIDEQSVAVSFSGESYSVFRSLKPGGWQPGNYTLHVFVDGSEGATKDFAVR